MLPFKINCCIFHMFSQSFSVFHKQNHATHDAVITLLTAVLVNSHNITCWYNDTKNNTHKHISSPIMWSTKHSKKQLKIQCVPPEG